MQVKIKRSTIFKSLFPPKANKYKIPLPDGDYIGEWSGWNIKIFKNNTAEVIANVETTEGLRGKLTMLAKIRNGNIKEMIQ